MTSAQDQLYIDETSGRGVGVEESKSEMRGTWLRELRKISERVSIDNSADTTERS